MMLWYILSSSESSNEGYENVYSDKSDADSDESNSELSEAGQDCEIVEFQQNCDESESQNELSHLQNSPCTESAQMIRFN